MLRKFKSGHETLSQAYQNMSHKQAATVKAVALGAMLMTPQLAFAAEGQDFFCYVATYFKQIVGGAALVVLLMWAIEHIFGVAKLHDVVIKVGISAAIVVGATGIIAKSGMVAPNCGLGLL